MRPGTIGAFEVVRELGHGGMGEVYLAQDTRLDRQVAIKALPSHLVHDADRLARFQREAKVLASLNHSGIGAIYGLEEVDGQRYLILEYVEGESLADLLARGPIPIEEALRIGAQVAEALEAASDKGVIHRDVKPGNVMITADGRAKVIDFGLARTDERAASTSAGHGLPDSPTVTPGPVHSPTVPGVIMGSAGYMSPEQARGKSVDKRSDIFSFGCVLFEMLSGAGPFPGETVADSLGAIMHREPAWAALPPGTPVRVRDLLASCLAKDRRQRLHDIGDARIELERALAGREWESASLAAGGRGGRGRMVGVAAGALALGVLIASVAWMLVSGRVSGDRGLASGNGIQFSIPMMSEPLLGDDATSRIAISPDGKTIVVSGCDETGKQQLYRRAMDSTVLTPIRGGEDSSAPAFSPDGQTLAMVKHDVGLCTIPLEGGPVVVVKKMDFEHRGVAWSEDGFIYYHEGSGLFPGISRVRPTSEADPEDVIVPGSLGKYMRWPSALPGGVGILCATFNGGDYSDSKVCVWTGKDKSLKVVLDRGFAPKYVAPGILVFGRGPNVWAVRFDLATLSIQGEPKVVLEGISSDPSAFGFVDLAASRDGTIAYTSGSFAEAATRLAWLGRDGGLVKTSVVNESAFFGKLTPDDLSLYGSFGLPTLQVALADLGRGTYRAFTSKGRNWFADTTADGKTLFYWANGDPARGLMMVPADLSAGPTNICPNAFQSGFGAFNLSPDGKYMFAAEDNANKPVVINLSDSPMTIHALAIGPVVTVPVPSPDGSMIAYTQDDGENKDQVFVRTYPDLRHAVQVSLSGGGMPRWAADGKSLFFARQDGTAFSIREVSITRPSSTTAPGSVGELAVGDEKPAVKGDFKMTDPEFLPSHDGKRFLVGVPEPRTGPERTGIVCLNWGKRMYAELSGVAAQK